MKRALLLAVGASLAAGFYALWSSEYQTGPVGPGPSLAPVPVEPVSSSHFALSEVADEAIVPAPPIPPRRAGAPLPSNPGLCPSPDEERRTIARPALARLLNESIDELVSRVRLIRREEDASPELRQGLALLETEGQGPAALRVFSEAPDRVQEGFDFGAAAAVLMSAKMASDPDAAREIVDLAKRLFPDSGPVWILSAHHQMANADGRLLRDSLARALDLGYEEPSVLLGLGRELAHTPHQTRAAELLRAYLVDYPEDLEIRRLAARLRARAERMSSYSSVDSSGITLLFHPDVEAAVAHQRLQDVVAALDDAARFMATDRRAELTVAIHGSKAEMRALTCIPSWTDGLFDGVLRFTAEAMRNEATTRRLVRHEAFHAQLASQTRRAPYWFNEGLAQRFAEESSPGHRADWSRIRNTGVYIPFPSLEGSFLEISDPQGARLAYHQSYAMVSMLIDHRGERVVGTRSDIWPSVGIRGGSLIS